MNFKQSVKRSHHIRQDDLKITILTKKRKKWWVSHEEP